MEAQPALVGAKRGIELDAEAPVDLDLSGIVDPWHAEDDLALGLAQPLDQGVIGIFGLLGNDPAQAFQHFDDSLVKLLLTRVTAQHVCQDGFKLFVDLHR